MLRYLFMAFILNASLTAYAQCKLDYSNYQLVFEDDFDTYSSLSDMTGQWQFTPDDPDYGWGDEWFKQSEVSLQPGGILRLTSKPISPTTIHPASGPREVHFESGMIQTVTGVDPACNWQSRDGFSYGMFELRAKLPPGQNGFWPTFWIYSGPTEIDFVDNLKPDPARQLQSGVIDWGQFPQVTPWDPWDVLPNYTGSAPEYECSNTYSVGDIVEYDGAYFEAIQFADRSCCGSIGIKSGYGDFSNDFNIYSAVWTPDEVTFFYNGREIYTERLISPDLNPCPAQILITLQMANWAPSGTQMDIDYIKVYHPVGNDFSQSYKSSDNWMHSNVSDLGGSSVQVHKDHGSIGTHPGNSDLIFFRSTDNQLYRARIVSGNWQISKLANLTGSKRVKGDILVGDNGSVFYKGYDNRLQNFWLDNGIYKHAWIDDNWSNNDRHVSSSKGSMAYHASLGIFYKGWDSKIHRYYWSGSDWSHERLINNYPNNAALVKGDVLVNSGGKVYYKGQDNRLQNIWKSGANYYHGWIDDAWSTSAFLVNSKAGSMVRTDNLGIVYIGTDDKIHRYYWSGDWIHQLIPYSYGSPSLGYPDADFAFGPLVWNETFDRVYYGGYDGRLQGFHYNSGSWGHIWVDDYWNTNIFDSYNSGSGSSSLVMGQDHRIIYSEEDKDLAYFKWETCEVVPECGGEIDIHRVANLTEEEPVQDGQIAIFPNPSNGIFQIQAATDEKKTYEVHSSIGTKEMNGFFQNDLSLDLSKKATGVYFLTILSAEGPKTYKLVKQ